MTESNRLVLLNGRDRTDEVLQIEPHEDKWRVVFKSNPDKAFHYGRHLERRNHGKVRSSPHKVSH